MDRTYLKSMAKEQISGKIGVLFLCTLLIYAVSSISAAIPLIGAAAAVVISPILTFGLALNYLNISRGGEADTKLMIEGFNSGKFGRIWLTYFLSELYVALWSLLFVIPGIVKSYAYIFAPYILADNPELTASEAIERSKQMTNGYKFDLFVLSLSFIGWILLVAVTFGIASIYVMPYMETTFANAYNYLKGGSVEIYDDDTPSNPQSIDPELLDD